MSSDLGAPEGFVEAHRQQKDRARGKTCETILTAMTFLMRASSFDMYNSSHQKQLKIAFNDKKYASKLLSHALMNAPKPGQHPSCTDTQSYSVFRYQGYELLSGLSWC